MSDVKEEKGSLGSSEKKPSVSKDKKQTDISLAGRVNDAATRWMEKNRSLSLRQTPVWAQSLSAGLLSLGTITILVSIFYKIDEVVTVRGQLKPIGGTVEVKTPVGGKIQQTLFADGARVQKGDLLLKFDTTQAQNDKKTFEKLIKSEVSSAETRKLYLESQLDVLAKKQDIFKRKIKTKKSILEDLQFLESQGGFQRVQVLEMQDQLLELQQSLAILEEEVEQTNYRLIEQKINSQKTIEQLTKSLNEAELQLKYQTVRAPVSGIIFDQDAFESGVLSPGERLLSIVSQKGLYAEVNIPNQDIGYIKVGQEADVRIDAFPFTQFGTIKGSVDNIGADALEPTSTIQFYSFLGKIKLNSSYLERNGRKIPLKPGMSVTTNLILGSKPLISLVSDLFVEQLDSVKGIRQVKP